MKKVGITESGTIIAEVSSEEWNQYMALGKVENRKHLSVYEWSQDLIHKLDQLKLPTRVRNCFARAAWVSTRDFVWNPAEQRREWMDCDPYVQDKWVFTIRDNLLDFDEWVDAILDGRISQEKLLTTRNFGHKSLVIFMSAIEGHKNAPVD